MTLYSTFICWLIFNELFVLALGLSLTYRAGTVSGLFHSTPNAQDRLLAQNGRRHRADDVHSRSRLRLPE
jgi:hypothetical protein